MLSLCAGLNSHIYAASSLKMDGNFDDWNSIKHDSVSSGGSFYSKIAVAYDESYIYVHGVEDQSVYEPYTYMNFNIIDDSGNNTRIVFAKGQEQNGLTNIQVKNQSWQNLKGGQGYRKPGENGGKGEWELRIPYDNKKGISKINLSLNYDQNTLFSPSLTSFIKEETTTTATTTTEKVTTSKQEVTTEKPANPNTTTTTKQESTTSMKPDAGIVIDGYYDDWSSYPHSYVINWNMPENQRNEYNCRQLAVSYDDNRVYMHVVMITPQNGGYAEPLNGNFYTLTIDGKPIKFILVNKNGDAFPGAATTAGVQDINVQFLNGQGQPDNMIIEGAQAKLTVNEGKAVECEVSLPLSMYETIYGKKVEDVKEMTMVNPNLFNGSVTIAGSSSGPIVGILLCIGVVAAATVIENRKKKKAIKE